MKPCNTSNILQLDGNISVSSIESESSDQSIAAMHQQAPDKIIAAQFLPTVATYNVRSIFPKLGNIRTDMLERQISVGFFSEVWEKSGKKSHKSQIEKLLEMDGLKYISTARPKGWGGAAIIANQDFFNLEKIDIIIPHNLEVIWGLLRSKSKEAKFKEIILCSFYSPPKSRKNLKLTDHLVTTLNMLKTRILTAPIIMGSDKNDMDIRPLLNCGLRLKQMVDLGTRKGKILDIILMNIPQMYNSPIIIPPVPCDNPSDGLPSDHWVPVCYPHTSSHQAPLRRFRKVTYRPLPAEGVTEFGKWITSENFEQITSAGSGGTHSTTQVHLFQNMLFNKLEETCPLKTMRIGPQDKAFINFELKSLARKKQREWIRKGKSEKYKILAAKFKKDYRAAAERYIRKKVDDLKEAQPGRAFRILKSMGAQPGDCYDDGTFTLPNHAELNLSDQECSEKIAAHFSSISSEFPPLSKAQLPERVRNRLEDKSNPPNYN